LQLRLVKQSRQHALCCCALLLLLLLLHGVAMLHVTYLVESSKLALVSSLWVL
jgi:hypothetical protein